MCPISRRNFVKTALVAGGLVSTPAFLRQARGENAPNERLRVGCIGLGSRGTGDVYGQIRHAELAALCDVDATHLAQARVRFRFQGETYADYRKVLDRDDIDVIMCGTPDHWHVKICLDALRANKHVFCEKPLTLTVAEGFLIRSVASQSDRKFQVGTQQRSDFAHFLRAVNMCHKGILGKIQNVVVGLPVSPGKAFNGVEFEPTDVPDGLDWNLWLGQSPQTPYIPRRCHGTFRYWFEYASGVIADWGAHHIDIALWLLDQNRPGTGPVSIDGRDSSAPCAYDEVGNPLSAKSFNTPNEFDFLCRFESGTTMHITSRADNGILVEGEKGRIFVDRQKITGLPIEEEWDRGAYTDEDRVRLYNNQPIMGHVDNFYHCIRNGGTPISDPQTHVQAMTTAHLCGIAARLKREIRWDPVAETVLGDDLAQSFLAREARAGFEVQ